MGCTPSKSNPEEKAAALHSARIDQKIKHDRKQESKTVKILLLGAGESGKSTIIKQMRIIHSSGFQVEERLAIKAVIYSNVVVAFRVLLDIMHDEKLDFQHAQHKSYAEMLETADIDVPAEQAFRDDKIQQAMLALWADPAIQKAVKRGHEFALNDNLNFYFKNLPRMFDPAWVPTDKDMLHARLRTTGITESIFELREMTFRMMDVGGQRSERKKWIHCFEGVQCLLFMASLSGYDQCLVEDMNANQMHEAFMLFESLVNGEWFRDKPIILFLNKIDLFREKMAISPVSQHFPDYAGGDTDEEAAKEYFANRFLSINKNTKREIYIHYTNATDTDLLKSTMKDVEDMLIKRNLQQLFS